MPILDELLADKGGTVVTSGVLGQVLRDLGLGVDTASFRAIASETGAGAHVYMAGYPTALSSVAPTVGNLFALPFWSARGGVVNKIGFNVTVVSSAGGLARCGIYGNDDTKGALPSKLLLDGGSDIAVDGSTGYKTHSISYPFEAGTLYWIAFICGVAAPTVTSISGDNAIYGFNTSMSQQFGYVKAAQGYGALPAIFPAGAPTTSTVVATLVEFASINR